MDGAADRAGFLGQGIRLCLGIVCEKFQFAALGAHVDVCFQSAGEQIGEIPQQPAGLAELYTFPAEKAHPFAAAQTGEVFHGSLPS